MYLLARYLPWAFQTYVRLLDFEHEADKYIEFSALLGINVDVSVGIEYSISQCKQWLAVQAVMLQLIITCVDIILMLRGECVSSHSPRNRCSG